MQICEVNGIAFLADRTEVAIVRGIVIMDNQYTHNFEFDRELGKLRTQAATPNNKSWSSWTRLGMHVKALAKELPMMYVEEE